MRKVAPVPASLISAEFSPSHELTWVYLNPQMGLRAVQEWYVVRCCAKSLLSTMKHFRLTVLCTHGIDAGFAVLIMCLCWQSVAHAWCTACKGEHTINFLYLLSVLFIFSSGNNVHIWARWWTDHIHVAAKWPSQHEGRPASHRLQHAPEGCCPGEGGQLLWSRRLLEASHRKSCLLACFQGWYN